jgi:serine/threonine-protein kinase
VVADFGIALAVSHAGGGRITETGLSLGTPHYMSPEQATGEKTLDVRTDVYALACVLYEMLAGEPPYSGSSAQAVLSKILTEEPRPLSEVRRSVPPNVANAVARALEKLPADRFESADGFAKALKDPSFRHEAPVAAVGLPRRGRASVSTAAFPYRSQTPLLAMSALALMTSGAAVMGWLKDPPPLPVQPVVREEVEVPGGFAATGGRLLTISRDGSAIAYVGFGEDGRAVLYLRRSNDLEARPIPGTAGSTNPEFSPDGEWIAFVRGDSILKASLNGGSPLPVTRTIVGPPSWGRDGFIYFSARDELRRVAELGGDSELVLASSESGITYRSPELLPDGRALLFTAYGTSINETEIRLLELETGAVRTLAAPGVAPTYVSTGHILYGHPDRALYAIPFDLRDHEVTGPAVPVLPTVAVFAGGATQFAVADNGTAVYSEDAGQELELVIVRPNGREDRVSIGVGRLAEPRFSPDGRRIAYTLGRDLYVHDLEVGTTLRLTNEGSNFLPIWSRDGDSITFQSEREGTLSFDGFRQPSDGSGEAEQLFKLELSQQPHAWTSNGRLLVREAHPERGSDLLVLSFEGGAVQVTPYLQAPWFETEPSLAPDERWVAYVSNERDTSEVYVRPFPNPDGGSWRISEGGGQEPVWGSDGRTLYYWAGSELRAVSVRTDPTFAVIGEETVLTKPSRYSSIQRAQYDVHPDGNSFVLVRDTASGAQGAASRFTIAVNWFSELRERTGSSSGTSANP